MAQCLVAEDRVAVTIIGASINRPAADVVRPVRELVIATMTPCAMAIPVVVAAVAAVHVMARMASMSAVYIAREA